MAREYDGMGWEDYENPAHRYDDEPCEICGHTGYCDQRIHAEYELRLDKLDQGLSSYKCGDCGGIISISNDWGWYQEYKHYSAWAQCCDKDCAVNYDLFYREDLTIVGVWRGYGGLQEAQYRSDPAQVPSGEIPF